MPNKAQPIGMLGTYGAQYGLPTGTAQEELSRRNVERFTPKNEDIIGEDKFGFGRLGNRIGNLLAAKSGMGEQELPPEEQRKFDITASAQDRFTKMREESPELWGGMSAEDKALTYRRFLADAADEFGETGLATQMNDEYTKAVNLRAKQQEELRRLGIQSDDAFEQLEQRKFDNHNARTYGAHTTGYLVDSQHPNSAMSGQQFPDGSFHYNDELGRPQVAKAGEWKKDRPQWHPQDRATTRGGGRGAATLTPSKIDEYRKDIVNQTGQLRISMEMHGIMADMAKEYGSLEFMSSAGGVTEFGVRLVENIAAMTRTAKNMSIPFLGADGKQAGSLNGYDDASIARFTKSKHAKTWMDDLDADFRESSHLRATFRASEAWKANVVRLAYARARAREPGARQLSDNDIQQARAELAAMSTDPGSFQQVMLSGLSGDIDKLEQGLLLIPEEERRGYFGPEGMEMYYGLRDQFFEAYGGHGFGTAPNPGPGLTQPPAGVNPNPERSDPTPRRARASDGQARGQVERAGRPQMPPGTHVGEAGESGAPEGMRPIYVDGVFVGFMPE